MSDKIEIPVGNETITFVSSVGAIKKYVVEEAKKEINKWLEKHPRIKIRKESNKHEKIERMAWELFIAEYKNFMDQAKDPGDIELSDGDGYCDSRVRFENCFYLAKKFCNFAEEFYNYAKEKEEGACE